jgi:hypothetical protein
LEDCVHYYLCENEIAVQDNRTYWPIIESISEQFLDFASVHTRLEPTPQRPRWWTGPKWREVSLNNYQALGSQVCRCDEDIFLSAKTKTESYESDQR